MNRIWPTFVVADDAHFEAALNKAWGLERTEDGGFRTRPLWTYFELAKAQQWLYLRQPERSWVTLKWFWEESPAPGLYTQWEGEGGDRFGGWAQIRGGVDLPRVTPHYWSAAEMLSLQLAMLSTTTLDRRSIRLLSAGVCRAPGLNILSRWQASLPLPGRLTGNGPVRPSSCMWTEIRCRSIWHPNPQQIPDCKSRFPLRHHPSAASARFVGTIP